MGTCAKVASAETGNDTAAHAATLRHSGRVAPRLQGASENQRARYARFVDFNGRHREMSRPRQPAVLHACAGRSPGEATGARREESHDPLRSIGLRVVARTGRGLVAGPARWCQ